MTNHLQSSCNSSTGLDCTNHCSKLHVDWSLQGETWPGNVGNGTVHRSPPIERFGARRLRLTIDKAASLQYAI